ncbi:sucrose-6-phosphate hydrolase [Lachnospiraceae bacterium]|nr:sucrose-6-phosphate hydrolase [Lachnospiraceae bacterium]
MTDSCIYLDTYVLQQDMRVRMPKSILSNLNVEKGETKFDVYLDREEKSIILKIHEENK